MSLEGIYFKMIVAIAGSRTITANDENYERLIVALKLLNLPTEHTVVTGGCRGVDKLGERYAEENDKQLILFYPDWGLHGRSAGPIRNRRMADACDVALLLWDGRSAGTRSMMQACVSFQKPFLCFPSPQG